VGAAKKLLQEAIDPMENALVQLIEEKRRGAKHAAIKWAKAVGADATAYMTVKTVIDGVQCVGTSKAKRLQLRQAALDISQLMLDELRYRRFQREAPGLFHYRMSKFTTSSYAHMARSLNAAIKYAEVDISDLDMPVAARFQVGVKLIDLFVETTGLVEIVYKRMGTKGGKGRPKDERYIVPTPETLDWLTKRNDALEFLSPVAMPMVAPPLPWAARACAAATGTLSATSTNSCAASCRASPHDRTDRDAARVRRAQPRAEHRMEDQR
jgi:DNA-directed RNA polymerase